MRLLDALMGVIARWLALVMVTHEAEPIEIAALSGLL